MDSKNITAYFHRLSDLFLHLEATDRHGAILPLGEGASKAVELILAVKEDSGKAMVIGNGGSVAIAEHMQNDLCKAVGVRAMAFTDTPLLTAMANDHGYECVFERPVQLWADTGDLLLAISSSGESENILRAVRASVGRGGQVITFSGFEADNSLRRMGHLNFYVPSQVYGYVEVVHSALTHFLTDCAVQSQSEAEDSRG